MIFDPAGNGIEGVNVFAKAAEKYGYILACSYNSKNGPLNLNFTAAASMLSDLARRFTLDEKRIYAAGFSGGSRFALALASSNSIFAGVIGCGAGLPNDKNLFPSGKSAFVYYGTAGSRDMNYLEMFDLMTFFNNNTQVVPYLRTFDGGHQWCSPEIAQEAIEWINLQAMKRNLITKDPDFILLCSNKIKTLVNNQTSAGNQLDAARYTRYAIRDFSGEQVSGDMTKSVTSLEQSGEFKDANHEWATIASLENSRKEKYVSLIGGILNSGSVPDSARFWWRGEIGSLKTLKEKANPLRSAMASRLLNFISIMCYEQGTPLYNQKLYDISGFFFEICTLSDSENMNNYYNLARALSGSNRKRDAVDALTKAFEHGFTIRKTVEAEPVFNNIRNDERYKALLMKMK